MADENLIDNDDLFFNDKDEEEIIEPKKDNNADIEKIYLEEKNMLIGMGFNEDLITKIYKNIHPVNIQEAIDYMNKDDNNKFIHSFIPNDKNVCLICEEKGNAHADEDNKDEEDDIIVQNKRILYDSLEIYEKKRQAKKNENSYNIYKTECEICEEEINYKDKKIITQPCKHYFCISCWYDYLKEKINNANVYKINCMKHECNYSLSEYFIKSIIGKDAQLLQKYDKFLSRKKLMESNKKIKFCPFPDCDGYAERKNKKEKIVKCNFGHDFCFNCGNKPHPKKKCEEIIDKDFERWKSGRVVKRCPHCKFWTEKNEGCNHMTCIECKFQWCWLCQKECLVGHYSNGACKGLHFEKEISEEKTKELLKRNLLKYPEKNRFYKLLGSFGYFMIYLFLCPYLFVIGNSIKCLEKLDSVVAGIFFGLTLIPFLICAEIQTVSFVIIISIPAIFIPPYFRFLRYIFFSRIFGRVISV